MAFTNKGRKVFVAVTAPAGAVPIEEPVDLNLAAYNALNWTEIKGVGNVGESGTQTNIVSYDELATDVTQKNKGISNAGDPIIECSRRATDNGQIALRAAGITKAYYAFKFEDDDMPSGGAHGTRYFNRGLVVGPVRPNGRNEDFNLENFTLGLVQREIVENAV